MHVITNKLTKDAFFKDRGEKGFMFILAMSEMNKHWQSGEKIYTNYKAFVYAKSPAHIEFCKKNYVKDAVISVSCESLISESEEYQGAQRVTNMMQNPQVKIVAFPPQQQSQGQQSQQQGGYNNQPQQQAPQQQRPVQQPQQPQQQGWGNQQQQPAAPQQQGWNTPQQGNQAPPDDDIPF